QAQINSADAALANLPGSSASDVQAARSAYDQANSQLQAAQAALKQNYNPTQASIAQAQAALESARSGLQSTQATQTALEQKAIGACADSVGPGGMTIAHNSTACAAAKSSADAAVAAANAAVQSAQGQLDLLKRGGGPSQQAQLQSA